MSEDQSKKVLVDAITTLLKDNKTVKLMFENFKVDINELDNMPIDFAPLEVSAKTRNGKVYLNDKLLEDDDFKDDIHYIVHEAVHWLQQTYGDARNYKKGPDDEYLDLPSEIEAFRYQVQFMKDFQSPERAEQYVDDLIDFHDLEDDERHSKKEELMGR